MLVSISILVVLLLLITSITHRITDAWKSTTDQGQSFTAAQSALEAIKRHLTQATLNTHWGYLDAAGASPNGGTSFVPKAYGRESNLFFLAGPSQTLLVDSAAPDDSYGPGSALFFQAPIGYAENGGLNGVADSLNTIGYFIKFEDDEASMPQWVRDLSTFRRRYRYRLYEVKQPTEDMMVYADMTSDTFYDWMRNASGTSPGAAGASARPIADNIILLLFRCIYTDATGKTVFSYTYNSRTGSGLPQPVTQHQLPSRVEVTLVALDENSAARLAAQNDTAAPVLVDSTLFSDPDKYDDDIAALEASLAEKRLRFHIFRDEIALLSSNWSAPQ